MTVRESDRTGDAGATKSPGAWIALSACLIAVFMQMLDLTIVHTAMPALARDLGASSAAELLIVSAYGLAFACTLPTAARIGDLLGRRLVFPAALAAFGAASLWCGIVSGAGELVVARGVAGIAAAMASAQTIAIITAAFPERARATAFGLYGAVAGLAGMAGPMLGGALVDADPLGLGWRAVFLINVPLAGVAVALANRLRSPVPQHAGWSGLGTEGGGAAMDPGRRVRETGRIPTPLAAQSGDCPDSAVNFRPGAGDGEECGVGTGLSRASYIAHTGSGSAPNSDLVVPEAESASLEGGWGGLVRRLDIKGAVLSASGLGLLVYPLTYGREMGWPPAILVPLALSVPVLVVFVIEQRRRAARGAEPLVRLELFADRGFGVGAVLMAVFYGVFTAMLFTVSVAAQSGLGWSASRTGLVMLPFAVGAVAGALSSPVLVSLCGTRALTAGMTVFAVGLGATAHTVHADGAGLDIRELVWPVFAAGAGMGWFAAPLPPLMIAGVADRAAGSASGIVPTVQQVGSSVGVAVLGMVFFARVAAQSYLAALTTVLWIMAGVSALLAVLTLALPGRRT
ncbi:MFS transporter [Nocardia sp. NBC_01388]|uniref:MFS transporter n=1 Tax=Nocardia sp. NBC_01388 TaxID=2903596 RepID=UPI0032494116